MHIDQKDVEKHVSQGPAGVSRPLVPGAFSAEHPTIIVEATAAAHSANTATDIHLDNIYRVKKKLKHRSDGGKLRVGDTATGEGIARLGLSEKYFSFDKSGNAKGFIPSSVFKRVVSDLIADGSIEIDRAKSEEHRNRMAEYDRREPWYLAYLESVTAGQMHVKLLGPWGRQQAADSHEVWSAQHQDAKNTGLYTAKSMKEAEEHAIAWFNGDLARKAAESAENLAAMGDCEGPEQKTLMNSGVIAGGITIALASFGGVIGYVNAPLGDLGFGILMGTLCIMTASGFALFKLGVFGTRVALLFLIVFILIASCMLTGYMIPAIVAAIKNLGGLT